MQYLKLQTHFSFELSLPYVFWRLSGQQAKTLSFFVPSDCFPVVTYCGIFAWNIIDFPAAHIIVDYIINIILSIISK